MIKILISVVYPLISYSRKINSKLVSNLCSPIHFGLRLNYVLKMKTKRFQDRERKGKMFLSHSRVESAGKPETLSRHIFFSQHTTKKQRLWDTPNKVKFSLKYVPKNNKF